MLPAKRALLSVSDKTGLVEFARGLVELGIEIVSTGGTARHLTDAGVTVTKVAEVTSFPEILGGRVKTLHPGIHGGILADRRQSRHLAELAEHDITPVDVVGVNLYPFQQTVEREDATPEEIVEMIDIGGPCMLRAAAKNHSGVVVVVDPADYPQILTALEEGRGTTPDPLRRSLALKAFRHTQSYDAAIAGWLATQTAEPLMTTPRHLTVELEREIAPRYGENPHQQAGVYRTEGGLGLLGGMTQHQGKELSWNNMLDTDAARRMAWQFDEPTAVIVKHNNPCGIGRGATLVEAYGRALACDPISAFGSIVAVNRPIVAADAEAMTELFIEVLVAPGFDPEALDLLSSKPNRRVLTAPALALSRSYLELRSIDGGFLAQTPDVEPDPASDWSCPTARQPSEAELSALDFAWRVSRQVKSNAIVVTNEVQTVGIGAGQMSRLDSCHLAISKAQLPLDGTVAASDAFFPFRDGLDVLASAGITAVVQPGGSKRDGEVIDAADEHEIAMLFTGRRHFKH